MCVCACARKGRGWAEEAGQRWNPVAPTRAAAAVDAPRCRSPLLPRPVSLSLACKNTHTYTHTHTRTHTHTHARTHLLAQLGHGARRCAHVLAPAQLRVELVGKVLHQHCGEEGEWW